jgi:hypothetical protein
MLYPTFSPLPISYRRATRRTTAADVDAGGRRGGERDRDVDYGSGHCDDKDMLPAYEGEGGPPKYAELEMRARMQAIQNGFGAGGNGDVPDVNSTSTCEIMEPRAVDDERERGRMTAYLRSDASLSFERSRSRSFQSHSELTAGDRP